MSLTTSGKEPFPTLFFIVVKRVGWTKTFILSGLNFIPPARPVLLVQDGHASHVTIDLIELARANDVHLLCLPAHTTHLLCPLDVGVLKSFKAHFSKASSVYMSRNVGRVITNDQLATLVATASILLLRTTSWVVLRKPVYFL